MGGDPGRINRRSAVLRRLSVGVIAILVLSAVWSTVRLADDLIHGGPRPIPQAPSFRPVQMCGSTVLAFALLYFELDSGGPAQRTHHMPATPQLAFPSKSPDLAVATWRPRFGDYLYLGFTNATAFSPTDVMPLARWGKSAMTAQALASLVVLSLVIAGAVSVRVYSNLATSQHLASNPETSRPGPTGEI